MTTENANFRDNAVVILAAGEGARMCSVLPKVLHHIAGAPILHHAIRTALSMAPARLAVVVGHGSEAIAASAKQLAPDAAICEQADQLGTGNAVRMAEPALADFEGDVFVLFGDTPFITAKTLAAMAKARRAGADLVALGFEAAVPGGYGRMVTRRGDALERIVEAKDASAAELAIRTCNSGVMAADRATLFRLLAQVGNDNAKREYYLTDVIGLARADGLSARVVRCSETETLGINTRMQLAEAEAVFQTNARHAAMLGGVTMIAPETVFMAWDTKLGRDVTIGPNVVLGPGVEIADGAVILPFSHLEACRVGPGAIVGPFARLRPGAEIGESAHIGNFVEIKNSNIGQGTKVSHLSYVGDTTIGARANLGAGTITCNYDGFAKYRTEIGAGAFIGVNTALIAPVKVGDNAYVGTGTVVTRDVPGDALALSRTPQTNREGAAPRLREAMRARSEKKKK
jgi:bifunctional UDP-N-acetylglucosamine pyrophosphorylase/glucosamine-1-phosphate N-acetyltransferase